MENIRYASVKVADKLSPVIVPITSDQKPDISLSITKKWKNTLNIICEVADVPSALIMRLHPDEIEVFVSSNNPDNPYIEHTKDKLRHGLYCETVVGKRKELLIPNALKNKKWKNNPDVKLNMISYYGLPIKWYDGEIFGTICILDNKENPYSDSIKKLLINFKETIESDLNQLKITKELRKKLSDKEVHIKEIHHRIKNQFNILISTIKLEKMKIKDIDQSISIMNDISSRIHAITLLHEKLYKSVNSPEKNTSLNAYLHELADIIISNISKKPIKLTFSGEQTYYVSDEMITFGLLLSEMLTNSIKYAFPEQKKPEIHISLNKKASDLIFVYSDNGIGLPDSNLDSYTTLGIELINALVKQLYGEIAVKNKNGLKYIFTIKRKVMTL